ncbi:MAG: RNase adapter RapZ [Rhodanobacteraceae bacterium]
MNKADSQDEGTRVLVLTGMSGGGKTVALRALEDLDYFCVDNLPTALIPSLVHELTQRAADRPQPIAVGVDIRNRSEDLQHMPDVLSQLAAENIQVQLLFLDSRDDVLIKRYSESRRRHPLSSNGMRLPDAITTERRLLRPLASIADQIVDTSELNVHQLRRMIATEIGRGSGRTTLMFESFAYRRGLPLDADFVFDARCLPNPHWVPALRPLSGRDEAVGQFFRDQPLVAQFQNDIHQFLNNWLPRFEHDKRGYVTVCIGCTGGRHRSVYLAEQLAEQFRDGERHVLSYHRELG